MPCHVSLELFKSLPIQLRRSALIAVLKQGKPRVRVIKKVLKAKIHNDLQYYSEFKENALRNNCVLSLPLKPPKVSSDFMSKGRKE